MFKTSIQKLKSTKNLTIIALLIATKIAIGSIYIPVGDNLRIYFKFFITALEGAMFGPSVAIITGALSDLIGFILFPSGPFFIGYTISSATGGLIFALFLYDTNITVLKLALSKLFVNIFVNIGMGSLWSSILFSKGYIYYLIQSTIKNIVLLPFEIILLTIVFNLLLPYLIKKGFIKDNPIPIKLF